jgi:tetratricopeptide (TPR) repeat protein
MAEVGLGVTDYKNARYESAIQHLQRAVTLDPTLVNARIYLATACAQQYVPGSEDPENLRMAERAIAEYGRVLELDPKNVNSVKGIAYLNLEMKHWDQAREYYLKAAEIDPQDPETYYSIGVLDWTLSYQPRMELFAELKLGPVDAEKFIQSPQCWGLRSKNLPLVEHGIKMMTRALELRHDYDDAMAYLNLLYRERADIQCGDLVAYQKDTETADKWVDLTMETKKKRVERVQPKN